MSIKEKFESHPVVWGLGLLFVGSVAGFGFNETISAKVDGMPSADNAAAVNCEIQGLEKLTETHHSRVSALQAELMKQEAGATDASLIVSYREDHKASAERLRKDIALENLNYKENLSTLEKKCT